jgi:hypothetical protein
MKCHHTGRPGGESHGVVPANGHPQRIPVNVIEMKRSHSPQSQGHQGMHQQQQQQREENVAPNNDDEMVDQNYKDTATEAQQLHPDAEYRLLEPPPSRLQGEIIPDVFEHEADLNASRPDEEKVARKERDADAGDTQQLRPSELFLWEADKEAMKATAERKEQDRQRRLKMLLQNVDQVFYIRVGVHAHTYMCMYAQMYAFVSHVAYMKRSRTDSTCVC